MKNFNRTPIANRKTDEFEESEDKKKKRSMFAKRKGLLLSKDVSNHLSSMIKEDSKKTSKKQKMNTEKSLDITDQDVPSRRSNRHIFNMNLNRSRKKSMMNNLNNKSSSMTPDSFNMDERTKKYIRSNFEERIQNETVLKAFIDRLVILRK
jgi:hypothetical protein